MGSCDYSTSCVEGELWPYGRDEVVWGHDGRSGALVVRCT